MTSSSSSPSRSNSTVEDIKVEVKGTYKSNPCRVWTQVSNRIESATVIRLLISRLHLNLWSTTRKTGSGQYRGSPTASELLHLWRCRCCRATTARSSRATNCSAGATTPSSASHGGAGTWPRRRTARPAAATPTTATVRAPTWAACSTPTVAPPATGRSSATWNPSPTAPSTWTKWWRRRCAASATPVRTVSATTRWWPTRCTGAATASTSASACSPTTRCCGWRAAPACPTLSSSSTWATGRWSSAARRRSCPSSPGAARRPPPTSSCPLMTSPRPASSVWAGPFDVFFHVLALTSQWGHDPPATNYSRGIERE